MSASQERWHSLTVEEIEDRLNTNTHTGLNSEDVKSRRRGENSGIFLFPQLSSKEATMLVLNDVALYFFAFVAVFCAVFQRWLEAVVALIIITVNCAVTVALKILANKYENAVMAPSIPRCDVLRDGRLLSIDGRSIVEGDVIYMKPGDILPCDVRITRASGFTVYEAVGTDDSGRLKYARSSKAADTMDVNMSVPIGKIYNMVFASSMVTSGYAVGIAVDCGQSTFIGKNYGGIEMRSENRKSSVDDVINKLFRYITIGLFAMIVPFIFVSLFSADATANPIDYFSQTAALAASLPLQTITVLYSAVICCAVRMCASGNGKFGRDYAIIKKYAAINRLNNSQKLFLFGKNTVAARGVCIESIYTDLKKSTSPDDTESSSDILLALEHAYLINKAAYGTDPENALTANYENLFLRELKEYGGDIERLTETGGYISHKRLGAELSADVAIVSFGDDFAKRSSLICRTLDRRIIDCAYWYSSDGVDVMIDNLTREKIRNEYDRLKALGYEVISVAKATPKLYDMSSFEEYEGQLIFEGMIAVGPVYSANNAESARELLALGMSPVVCLPEESDESLYIVKNVFREARREPSIVRASELIASGERIIDYPGADAYIGFGRNELSELIEFLRTNGTSCASAVIDFNDLSCAGKSDFIIAYSYDTVTENACVEPYPIKYNDIGAACSAGKKYADLLVSPVTPQGGGIDGVLNALRHIRSFFGNLESAVSYLLCSLVARAIAVYLPLLFGRPAMNAAMILYLGCIVDLAAILAISCRPDSAPKKKGSESFASCISLLKSNLKELLLSVLCGAVIFAAGMMIPVSSSEEMQAYTLVALLALQITRLVFILMGRREKNRKGAILSIAVPVAAIVLLSLILALIPGLGTVLGLRGGITAYLRALIITVITAALCFGFYKYQNKE